MGVAAHPTEWQCGDAVEYQGHAYATVLIDDQCWFAENLQNAYLNTGGELFEIDNEEDWLFNFDNNYAGYCHPLSFDGFGPNFGKLYNIHAILSPHLRPADWHVSTDADWFSLETHLGMPVEALTTPDRELYEIGHDLKDDELWNGTNDTGFSVVPAGEKWPQWICPTRLQRFLFDHHPTRWVQRLRRPFLRGRRNCGLRILLRARRLFGALCEGLT